MQLVKELKITELKISANRFQIKGQSNGYESTLELDENTLSLFDIQPTKDLVGKRLTMTLEPKRYKVYEKNNVVTDNLEANDVYIGDIKMIVKRSRFYGAIPHIEVRDETLYVAFFYTPIRGGTLTLVPCPYYELKLNLSEVEYRELLKLPAQTTMKLRAQVEG